MSAIAELETPCLLLDRTRVEANAARMHRRLNGCGVTLRPHLKTAKNAEVAHILTRGQAGGITVSTLREADYFAANGFSDIVYAVGIAPNKMGHAARLLKQGIRLTVVLDNLPAAQALAAKGREAGVVFPVLIEIDCDGHRSGLAPADPAVGRIARTLSEGAGTELRGLMTHAGGAYDCDTRPCLVAAAENERATLAELAQRLRGEGIRVEVVSIGSTPTASVAERFDGVTEVRAGVFVFFDLLMANMGVCGMDDIALSVLTTVIGHRPEKSWLITDSGWMALSSDQSTTNGRTDYRFGQVCDLSLRPIHDLTVIATNQEHGIVARRGGGFMDLAAYPVGMMLRVLPIHACATAASHRLYNVVEDGRVVAEWERANGW